MSAVHPLRNDATAATAARRPDPLRREMVLLLLLASLLMLSMGDGADPDLWGHVRYGQDVLATGRLPATATYTFTAVGHPWINHENVSEILFAFVANHAGGPGLMVLKDLLGLALVGLLLATAYRRGVSLLPTALTVAMVGWSISPGWSVRPQIFTYTLFAIVVWLIDGSVDASAPAGRRVRSTIWIIPVVFAAWVNTHGGFLAGLGVAAIYLGARSLEMLRRHGREALGDVCRLGLVLAVTGVALLANPYGPQLIVWLVRDLAPPRPEISEWQPLGPANPPAVVAMILLAMTAIAALLARPPDLPRLLVLAFVAWQAIAHARHVPFFAILAGFWLPPELDRLRARLSRRPVEPVATGPPPPESAVRRVRLVARVFAAIMIAGMAYHSRALWVRKNTYPVEAIDYMARHRVGGKLLVHFDWAQYALAAFAPESTVAFDGRFRTCYPQEIADMHFDFLIGDLPAHRWRDPSSPPVDEDRALDYGHPDVVLIRRESPHAVGILRSRPDWVLLYQDALAQVWGRRDRYDDPASPLYLPAEAREITDRPQKGWAAWPAFPAEGRVRAAS